ncbi:Hypothetical protein D9617_37g012650 [Elsinoe fawcettii]|nr:Hypothetical protein D9617_37g012650 [Elsinoe fawcettii]
MALPDWWEWWVASKLDRPIVDEDSSSKGNSERISRLQQYDLMSDLLFSTTASPSSSLPRFDVKASAVLGTQGFDQLPLSKELPAAASEGPSIRHYLESVQLKVLYH